MQKIRINSIHRIMHRLQRPKHIRKRTRIPKVQKAFKDILLKAIGGNNQ